MKRAHAAALASLLAVSSAIAACDRGASERRTDDVGASQPRIAASAPASGAAPAASAPASGAAPAAAPARHEGPLVVALVVDQLAAWVASERLPLLPRDGGFARLLREGTYAREMRYAHAATDTAPGHASLYTGAPPRKSGVWSNEIIDPATHATHSILLDDKTKLVFPNATALDGASAAVLQAETVADRLLTAHPNAVVVSLSLKDRGAIFAGGQKPTATLWYDRSLDRFVTSTAFATKFPAWADPITPASERNAPWDLLDPGWVKDHAATPDDENGEASAGGLKPIFPHDIPKAKDPARAFLASPFGDDAILRLGLAALDAYSASKEPRLLALSLSGNDYIGHSFGPDSWEAWDELERLDASLARFFTELDRRFGQDGWSAVLSGDHGITSMPEATALPAVRPYCRPGAKPDRWQRACGPVGRLFSLDLFAELRDTAQKALHRDGLVAGVVDPYVYLTPEAKALPAVFRSALVSSLSAALRKHPQIDRVIDTSTLPETCPPESNESVEALVCRAFVPGKAGDLYIVVKRGSFFDPEIEHGKGTSHGSPWLYDRTVPLLARAPGSGVNGRVIDEPISYRSFAQTLSTMLGVEAPNPQAPVATDLAARAP